VDGFVSHHLAIDLDIDIRMRALREISMNLHDLSLFSPATSLRLLTLPPSIFRPLLLDWKCLLCNSSSVAPRVSHTAYPGQQHSVLVSPVYGVLHPSPVPPSSGTAAGAGAASGQPDSAG
ncbi:hypothetical protein T310_10291, partial [Rasamsonia emersonii CBS 393.64]